MKNISQKYLSKISLLVSVLLILFIVVSCTPQITDEELEVELSKLTLEEREALLKDLESKSAFAGQAVAGKYGISPGAAQISTGALRRVLKTYDYPPEMRAGIACTHPKSPGKKVHYCSENSDGTIKYDRFRCVSKPSGNIPVHEIDTTYKKSLLYKEVDNCPAILAQFSGKSDAAVIGCYDSDPGTLNNVAGYIEMIQIQTGNKAPTASSASANLIKEVDACSGVKAGVEVKCFAGNPFDGFPTAGYTGIPSTCTYVEVNPAKGFKYTIMALGTVLFERKCPALFASSATEFNTEIIYNCPYVTGYHCFNGKCDSNLPAKFWQATDNAPEDSPCKGHPGCLIDQDEILLYSEEY